MRWPLTICVDRTYIGARGGDVYEPDPWWRLWRRDPFINRCWFAPWWIVWLYRWLPHKAGWDWKRELSPDFARGGLLAERWSVFYCAVGPGRPRPFFEVRWGDHRWRRLYLQPLEWGACT